MGPDGVSDRPWQTPLLGSALFLTLVTPCVFTGKGARRGGAWLNLAQAAASTLCCEGREQVPGHEATLPLLLP